MNVIKPRRENLTGGTPMHEALTPVQCAEMRTFLRALKHYSKEQHMGQREMSRFLTAYVRMTTNGTRRRMAK